MIASRPFAMSLAVCLSLVACEREKPREMPQPAAPTTRDVAPARAQRAPAEGTLTATSPTTPASIAAPAHDHAPSPLAAEPPRGEPSAPEVGRTLEPSEVEVERFVLAEDVRAREPVGETDVFAADAPQVLAFVQLANSGVPYAIEVHFEPADGPPSRYGVELTVPTSPRYRTWAWTRIRRSPGRYRAVLRTPEGAEIAHREFVIEAALPEPAHEDAGHDEPTDDALPFEG